MSSANDFFRFNSPKNKPIIVPFVKDTSSESDNSSPNSFTSEETKKSNHFLEDSVYSTSCLFDPIPEVN